MTQCFVEKNAWTINSSDGKKFNDLNPNNFHSNWKFNSMLLSIMNKLEHFDVAHILWQQQQRTFLFTNDKHIEHQRSSVTSGD